MESKSYHNYCLGKQQESYETAIRQVIRQCEAIIGNPAPSKVICDFERAEINAAKAAFAAVGVNVTVQGCFFHLCQSTWRKIQEIGLVTTYRDNEEIRLFCGMLDALAFLPVDEVCNHVDNN